MLLQRIRKQWNKQDWVGILIEFILLIIGITVAFQLNVSQQNSNQKRQINSLVEKVQIENEINIDELGNDLSERSQTIE